MSSQNGEPKSSQDRHAPPDLEEVVVAIESAVSIDGEGFCLIKLGDSELGQLSPQQTRDAAMSWMTAAEAAESDAATYRLLKTMGLDDDAVGQFIWNLRRARQATHVYGDKPVERHV